MATVSTQLTALDRAIDAILSQIESVSAMQSSAAEAPEVLRFSIGGKDTEFVGPDRAANAIARLTQAWLDLSERREQLQSRLNRANSGGRIRRAGVRP